MAANYLLAETLQKESVRDAFLIVGIFIVALAAIDVGADIPLNDDWSFALATWHFADHGEFRLARMTAMSLKAQILWGAAWTVAFGKSFAVLRIATLTLSFASLFIVAAIMRRLEWRRSTRLLALAALALNPVFLSLSFTFMTQIPYLFCVALAIYGYVRSFQQNRVRWFAFGLWAAAVGCFVRQTGVVYLAAPLIILFVSEDARPGKWKWFAGSSAAAVVVFFVMYATNDLLHGYPQQIDQHFEVWEGAILWKFATLVSITHRYVVQTFSHSALHFLPLTIIAVWSWRKAPPFVRVATFVLIPFFLWPAAESVAFKYPMLFHQFGNVIGNFSIGPHTLRDVATFKYPYPFHFPRLPIVLLSYATAAAGAILLAWFALCLRQVLRREVDAVTAVLVAASTGSTLILVASGIYFDRYALDALWLAVLIFPPLFSPARRSQLVAWAAVALMAFFSIGGTSDYVEWNLARWRAFEYLRFRGVELSQMDGGYEINQYLVGGFDGPTHLRLPKFSVVDDRFILVFQEVDGYRVLRRFPYRGFFGLHRGEILALERTSGFVPQFDLD